MASAAVFWDRDGTLIKDPGYLRDPDQVEPLPGAAEALRRLHETGFLNIITTNQSGLARGLLDEATLEKIHDRMRERLGDAGRFIDAIYYCPYLDGEEAVVEAYRKDSELRKPKPGMLLQAALDHQLDLAACWSIGDSVRDAQAGRAAGCRTILIRPPAPPTGQPLDSSVDFAVSSLEEAVDVILRHTRTARPSQPAPEPRSVEPAAAAGEATAVLKEILAFLRTVDRREQSEDFSFANLAGAIVQIAALAALIYAIFGWINDDLLGSQMVRLQMATVLQVLAMTFFLMGRRR